MGKLQIALPAIALALIHQGALAQVVAKAAEPVFTAPVWKTALSGTQLDTLEILPDDRLLVGTVRESYDRLAGSTYRRFLELSMLQASNGAPIWRYERDRNTETFGIVATDPMIVCTSSTSQESSVFALDPQTGARVWRSSRLSRVTVVPGTGTALAFKRGALFGQSVVAVRLTDGEELWSVDVAREQKRRAPRIEIRDAVAYVVGEDVVKISLSDGKPAWRQKSPVKIHPLMQTAYTDLAVVLSDGEMLAALDAATGDTVWSSSKEEEGTLALAADGSNLYQLVKSSNGFALKALDPATGTERWRSNEARPLQSALLREARRLIYVTEFHLVALDPASGKELLRAPLPLWLVIRDPAPRVLRAEGPLLTIAAQAGIAVFDLDRGAWTVREEVDATAELRVGLRAEELKDVQAAAPRFSAAVPASDPLHGNYALQQAQRHVERTRRDLERAKEPGSSALGRELAYSANRQAIQGQILTMQSAQAQERSAAMQNLANSIRDAGDAILAAIKRTQELSAYWTQADAAHAYSGMLLGELYVRPLSGPPLALHVVDLRRGARARINLLTDRERNRHRSTIYVVDPNNRRVIALVERADESAAAVERFDKQVPARHIAAFDMDALDFQPMDQPAKRETIPQWFIAGDKFHVGIMIKAVYKGNASAHWSLTPNRKATPLMLAAYGGPPDLVRWLLEQGADVSPVDERGWRAEDYARAANRPEIAELIGRPKP